METTTKASFDSCVKNDDEIVVAYCGPVAEIVAQKLVDLLSSSSSRTSSQRRISPLKLGEIIQEEEEEEEDKEEDNDNAMTTTKTTTTPTTHRVVVIVVETVENDEIAKEGLEVVKILLNALKKINKTTKKGKRGGNTSSLASGTRDSSQRDNTSARTKIQRKIVTPPREF